MKKIFTKKIVLIGILLALIVIISPLANNAAAQGEKTTSGYRYYVGGWEIIPRECIDPKEKDSKNVLIRCDANSFVQLFVNFANIMLKLSPPLVVLVFMYGGVKFISAKGKQETIQAGKKILGSAALGMAIITFLGWTITFFIVQALTGLPSGKLFNNVTNFTAQDWWNPSAVTDNSDDTNLDQQCCVVTGVGCAMKTESACDELSDIYTGYGVGPANNAPNTTSCGEVSDPCGNYTKITDGGYNNGAWKCCVVPQTAPLPYQRTCHRPNERGCLDYSHTIPDGTTCENLVGRCDDGIL